MSQHNPWPDEGNTGHIWDEDLRELDNPPPLWWMLSFYAGFVMIIVYTFYYPAIPLIDSHTKGLAGWTQIGEYKSDFKVLKDWRRSKFADKEEQLAAKSVDEILQDEELKDYAVATSKVLFGDYCAACHGVGGQGGPSFPVLADDDWLWGGKVSQIETTITNGRLGYMPARGLTGTLTADDIDVVADYVISLSEGETGTPAGKAAYQKGLCFACHGPTGKPLAPTGAANLTDSIWRFSGKKEDIVKIITHGVNVKKEGKLTISGEMPAFKERLPNAEVNIKRLTIYVHQFGGGL